MQSEHSKEPVLVRGVIEAASTDTEGVYIRVRLIRNDATKLMEAGAFGRIVQVSFG